MDYFNALVSVNKISIFFFVVTLLFIFYEFYLFQKERRKHKDVPVNVPEMKENPTITVKIPALKVSDEKPKTSKRPKTLLFVGGILLAIFILVFVASYIFISQKPPQEEAPAIVQQNTPTPTSVVSPSPLPTEAASTLPSETPTPTTALLAQEETTDEAELIEEEVEEEEVVVAEETEVPTEAEEIEELPQAGNVNYASIIFASALVFFFVAFIL